MVDHYSSLNQLLRDWYVISLHNFSLFSLKKEPEEFGPLFLSLKILSDLTS